MTSAYDRLSVQDRNNFWVETPDTPMHIMAVLQLEPTSLIDKRGHLKLDAILGQIDQRLARVPRLRQVAAHGGLLTGPPVWVDEPGFDLRRHLHSVLLPQPGDERQVLDLVASIDERRLDRSHALWELWLVTGLESGRVAAVFKLHHAIADGLAAIRLIGALFDFSAEGNASDVATSWRPAPAPLRRELIRDNLASKLSGVRHALSTRPAAVGGSVASTLRTLRFVANQATRAPRCSINRPVGHRRRLDVLRIPLAEAKAIAHAHGGKVNDVLLGLVAGGLRALLTARGELVPGGRLFASVPVSIRKDLELGNEVGTMIVPISIAAATPQSRLEAQVVASDAARHEQNAVGGMVVWSAMARTGIARRLSRSQRFVNLFVTNVAGPPIPVYVLGARVLDVIAVTTLAGNCALGFAALSYNGSLAITIVADPDQCPDPGVVTAAMARDWATLCENLRVPEPAG